MTTPPTKPKPTDIHVFKGEDIDVRITRAELQRQLDRNAAWTYGLKIAKESQQRQDADLISEAEHGSKFRHTHRQPLKKTTYYRDVIALFPTGRDCNIKAANHIFDTAPRTDDGVAPFYWRGNIPNVELMDREHNLPITIAQMTSQIQAAKRRPPKT